MNKLLSIPEKNSDNPKRSKSIYLISLGDLIEEEDNMKFSKDLIKNFKVSGK